MIFQITIIILFKYTAKAHENIDHNLESEHDLSIEGAGHVFFRSLDNLTGTMDGSRRVFGGTVADVGEFPAVCALLDHLWTVRCSASIIAPHWVVTAAHCVSPRLVYVKYNTRRPASTNGSYATVDHLYQHPRYKVVQRDDGRGLDVAVLHNDVGLVRTKQTMEVKTASDLLTNLRRYKPVDLYRQEVLVLGYGRTEQQVAGEELFSVQLELVGCRRDSWSYCACGTTRTHPRGVCSGDSGGPVIYDGILIGITSMGPVECAAGDTPVGLTSVFTTLYHYADVINNTIQDVEESIRMRDISLSVMLHPNKMVYLTFILLY